MYNLKLYNLIEKIKMIILVCGLLYAMFNGLQAGALEDERFQAIIGPRIGMTYVFMDWGVYNEKLNSAGFLPAIGAPRSYVPLHTTFALNLEQRILLGTSDSHFCFQELLGVSGVEQSITIPMGAFLLGFRSGTGFELGMGPVASLSGLSVAVAVGWNFCFQDINLPVDIVFVPDFYSGNHSISLYTGFNFDFKKR